MIPKNWLVPLAVASCFAASFSHAEQVVLSEIMYHPPASLPEYIEVFNNTSTPLDMAKWRLRGGVDYDFPDFASGDPQATFLRPFERILLSSVDAAALRAAYPIPAQVRIYGPWTGNLDNAGETVALKDKNGVVVCTVTYNDRGKWPVAADGAGHSLVLIDPDRKIDDWRNWTFSQRRLGTPGTEPVAEAETAVANPEINLAEGIPFVNFSDFWRYDDTGTDRNTAWREPSYNDSGWGWGQATFGYGDPVATTISYGPDSNNKYLTYYFRTRFVYNGSPQNVTVTIDQILDDGAVYYLNGIEIGRSGMPSGGITFNTAASRTVGDASEELNVITTSGSALVNGTNVLAVEVHQTSVTSSDVGFACRLKISVPSQPSLVINEVLPGSSGAGFVEFYNPGAAPINLRNYYLSDDPAHLTKFRIPSDVIVSAGGFASVGYAESGLGMGDPVTVYLVDPDGVTAINAIQASIPLDGRSIGRKPTGSNAWFLFVDPSRDMANESQSSLAAHIRLNEVHFSTSNTVDFVEFFNAGDAAISLDGLFLATDRELTDKLPLSGALSSPGFLSLDTAFPAPNGEVTLYLVNAANAVLAARIYEKTGLGPSVQAFPDGSMEWYGAAVGSRNAPNNPPRQTDIVINEIMYDPPSDEVAGEFVELYNRGTVPVAVSNWRFVDGIDFAIPPDTTIPPNGYLVIGADEAWMRSAYGAIPVIGNFSGRLDNNGELVRLVDQWGNLVDEVDYLTGGDWPNLANGDGSSMELRNAWMDNSLPSAWTDSNETNKSSFQPYQYSDVFRQLHTRGSATDYKELQFHLVGDSHVVLNNIQMRLNGTGGNLILNGGQMSTDGRSASGWLAQGTHHASHIQYGELHLIADGHGDNRANRVEIDVTGIQANQAYQVSFNARWVAGSPRLVVQTWDHSIATSIPLPIPKNLGTPGFLNSKHNASPIPQVDDLLHRPAVPASGEPVLITAKITAASPPSQVLLYHRLDNNEGNGAWSSKTMYDNGFSGGDTVAGDGIYTAQLTEYGANGQVVQFYVLASGGGSSSQMPKWGAERPAMYVVDTPSSLGDLRRMRFVVSALDLRTISQQDSPTGPYGYKFPRLSNHYFNMTTIVNEQKVIYNCEVRTSGSPWTRGGSLDRGKYKFPKDKLFRGKQKQMIDNDAAGGSRHHNRIHRYWLYLFGHPVNENEYVLVEINNGGSNLREETEPLGNDLLDRVYANGSQGELYRIDDEWWFSDDWGRDQRNADWSYKGTDNEGRYRTEWMKRSLEDEDDHSALVSLFKKINSAYTQDEIERLVDPYDTMKMSAIRGYSYDWDSFSLNRGKNGYLYRRSTDGLFMFFHWDSDLSFQDANNSFVNGMPGFQPYIQKSYNMRLFKHYLTVLVERYTRNSPRMNAWLQAEEDASSQYSVSSTYQSWFASRETPALNFIGANRNVAFNITSNGGNPITTASPTMNLTGTAPLRVFRVEVVGHPEALCSWANDTTWNLTGILLQTGVNVLTLNAVDDQGNVFHTDVITVNKTGNAPPVMALDANPKSWHLSVLDVLEMDARDSYDPDGTPLTFSWSVAPVDAQLDASREDRATLFSPRPGLYNVAVTGTDADGGAATLQREAAVYAPDGFSPFNVPLLEPYWELENVELRQNHDVSSYYSLTEIDGHLVLNLLNDVARPLTTGSPKYPFVWRALPQLGDWVFMTKVGVRGLVFGDYTTGLMLEMIEGGTVRYVMGIDSGNSLIVQRITAAGSVSTLKAQSWKTREVGVRARRAGNTLYFEYLEEDQWKPFHAAGLPSETTGLKAGLFLATDTPQRIKATFDYALLIDPSATSDLRDNLRISEIMYNPLGGSDFEFIELANIGDASLDLTGVRFTEGIDYTFGSLLLAPRQHVVVVQNLAAFASRYNIATINIAPGEYAGRLANSGETVSLSDAQGVLILSVTYGTSGAWPSEADGSGSSLELVDPDGNPSDGSNWRASPEINGSPGLGGSDALGTVLINEALTHTDAPFEDAIELFNRTSDPIDVSGWFLSDATDNFKKFRIPDSTVIPGHGYAVFYELDFNTNNPLDPFSLSSVHGDQVYLSGADALGNLTGYQVSADFGAAQNGVAFGRYETSVGEDFPSLLAHTFGADAPASLTEFRTGTGLPNAAPRVPSVVINEVMYHPPDLGGTNDNVLDEFVELHNRSLSSVVLFDPAYLTNTWHLRGGPDFDFPMGLTLPAGGYLLVVSFDPATNAAALTAFRATYGVPASVPVYGPYAGKLDNSDESVKLLQPDTPQGPGPDEGFVPYVLLDQMRYSEDPPWPGTPDGAGDSLQRRRPHEYANDPVNWKGAAPTPGRANVSGSDFVDSDGDSLPDAYETAQGFNPNNSADADLDADGDGKTNREEFLDETDPRNELDRLRAPEIVVEPQDRTAAADGVTSFSVTASGTQPLSYQWWWNGSPLLKATNAVLVMTGVQGSDAGDYRVVVRNAAGFVHSQPARLTVIQPLEILAQPLSQFADRGGSATFTVFAVGTGPLTYQWRFNGVDLPGETGDSLALTGLQPDDTGNYSVVVADDNSSVESAQATLTVLSPPVILQHPQDQTVVAYNDLFFSVTAGGQGPFSYQWRFNGVAIVGATNSVLALHHVQPSQAGNYSVDVLNPVSSVQSSNAYLSILIPATITLQPQSQIVEPGSTVTFQVAASSTTPLTFQWQFNDADIPGETSSTLTIVNAQDQDSGNYRVVVTDDIGSINSDIAVLTVLTVPVVLQPPLSQTVVEGGSVTFSIEVKGALPMSYRWRRGYATVTNLMLQSHQAFLTLQNVRTNDADRYTVVLTNAASYFPGVLSPAALLTVLPDQDGDGMADAWEVAHSLNPADPNDAALDGDGDQLSNLDEHRSGTDPGDPDSYLQVLALESGSSSQIQFSAASNMTYSVEYTDDLGLGLWRKLHDVVARPTNWVGTIFDPDSGSKRFYRIVTPRQPDAD